VRKNLLSVSGLSFWKAGVLVVTRLLFKDGIQLNGLPASLTDAHRRLFALPPCRSAVSTLPSSVLNDLAQIIVISRMDVPFLLWSQDSRLASLRTLQFCVVCGVSSNACAFESRPPAHQPMLFLGAVANKNFGVFDNTNSNTPLRLSLMNKIIGN